MTDTSEEITLSIKFPDSKIYSLKVSLREDITKILSRLGHLREDSYWNEYRLVYSGRYCNTYNIAQHNERQLENNKIKDGTTIHVIYNLRGD